MLAYRLFYAEYATPMTSADETSAAVKKPSRKSSKKTCKQTGRKDRRAWMTGPEEAYLRGRLGDFEKARDVNDLGNFWPSLHQDYWNLFPVPEPKSAYK